ncbi:MAG: glycosyltransferase family 2 protein [Collinsella sp.]
MPTYNAEPYLSQAIGSLLNENKIELEILAINDGSTDNSLAVMQEFAARDSRARVIDKANQGYGATCNLGIREAKGDWIAILEPDDWIEPGMYSDMLAFAMREFGVEQARYYRDPVLDRSQRYPKRSNYIAHIAVH